MLQLSGSFLNKPVMSLRTGGEVATVLGPIINPNNLKIEGFYCQDRFDNSRLVLLTQDIRDLLKQGFVVDDHEVLTEPGELVRLRKVLEVNFQLPGKLVITVDKHKIGKVVDFAAETTTFYIQKIYVGQSMLKSLSTSQLSVDRTQIVEITNRKIVIQEILKPTKSAVPAAAGAN
jgi:uncharacterized protein YrrD